MQTTRKNNNSIRYFCLDIRNRYSWNILVLLVSLVLMIKKRNSLRLSKKKKIGETKLTKIKSERRIIAATMYQRSIIHRWKLARLASDKSSLLRVANGPLGSTLTNYKNSTNFKSCVIKIDKGIKYEKTVSSQREMERRGIDGCITSRHLWKTSQ